MTREWQAGNHHQLITELVGIDHCRRCDSTLENPFNTWVETYMVMGTQETLERFTFLMTWQAAYHELPIGLDVTKHIATSYDW